jgi:SAM-dependent methyltransferase
LGCGNGVFTKKLSERFNNILGTDVSPNMVDICKQSFPDIKFQVLDLESEFKIEGKFDLIVCKLVLMFIDDVDNMASESFKALNQGGHLIVSVPHPAYWLAYYLQNKYGVKEHPEFSIMENGYFSEKPIHRSIGGNKDLKFDFKFRTLGTYLNAFSKAGFCLEKVLEPMLTKKFLNKVPEETDKSDIPMRLNMLFKKL